MSELITLKQACEMMNISARTAYRLMDAGLLIRAPHRLQPGRVYFLKSFITRLMEQVVDEAKLAVEAKKESRIRQQNQQNLEERQEIEEAPRTSLFL